MDLSLSFLGPVLSSLHISPCCPSRIALTLLHFLAGQILLPYRVPFFVSDLFFFFLSSSAIGKQSLTLTVFKIFSFVIRL